MRYLPAFVGLLISITHLATARADTAYTVKTDASVVSYHIHVPGSLEKATGPSHKVEGSAQISASGAVTAVLRAPIVSFESGNGKRDNKMHDATEAARYPVVEVKLHGDGVAVPASFPTSITRTMKAEIVFHGITQTVDAPCTIKFEAANRIVASTAFFLSLEAFKVERPKLLFWRVADDVRIQADITLVQ
jgi:YceI-like domain